MKYVKQIVIFAAASFVLWIFGMFAFVGVSCFKHGDVGPYPEADWAAQWWLPVSMGIAFLVAVFSDKESET